MLNAAVVYVFPAGREEDAGVMLRRLGWHGFDAELEDDPTDGWARVIVIPAAQYARLRALQLRDPRLLGAC